MKRTGNLFERILERENLRRAFLRAVCGKRAHPEARRYAANLEANLFRMREQLAAENIPLGRFRQFVIHDPKERIITAPCFEERVLHHAIMNICEPAFDRWLIDDTFACRTGKGREAAVLRAAMFARRCPVFLKLDIRKYFDSVSHDLLLSRLSRRFKDDSLLRLFERIVRCFRGDGRCGLPIGSLTSQHFANFYLGWFDRFVKETLRVRGYVRYMDDMVLWGDDLQAQKQVLGECETFLSQELHLELKPPFLNRTVHGMDFLGCRVFPTHRTLSRRSRRRFRDKLRQLEREFQAGELTERELQGRAEAAIAFARGAGVSSWRFRQAALQQMEW